MISIIIPVLNEEEKLANLLQELKQIEDPISFEIIVVDGGSQDQTVAIASKFAAVYQLKQANRGAQLKLGAEKSSGDILWFLHSDSKLADYRQGLRQIQDSLKDPRYSAGYFQLVFDSQDFFYRYLAKTSNLRARFLGLIFGDQGLFTTRQQYEKTGGFEEIPLMEDWRFSRKLWKQGKFYQLPITITTSSRRFRKGKIRTHLKMHKIKLLYLLGVPPEKLVRRYYK
ncbi:TIGR04283 family arsenosugar biosynthesis glycosyltransferase [Enterococcus dongliensis]|uniref:4,4'-diaponeurosporenoate glycosyltransferase n=1 Tax=Enterococcus dongliensis TaxID=2559925 RepID=A0AAP5NI85_9ENTE|nr:TIGR04283 family arsenosugar biosynthesis glycosyltransferase [Enterococcus dongliensis]MDT2595684.1 TIGR04283 family arsenosugar biosynthesis glycosyltransferase [Enterococcus dongliensis]MDT2602644.1 TIGR04283 family arsenosugar biosynthesis glycosyltransferase [Enterococcus dongliensis]MDT2633868.1 TIGR04283 family arsenosugar biosynthesis glycosyltransferase [Enterococcus dongliensis]MDT2636296.1 TIGR04283 family arsenosugar biosynthesis glycosyltransferase [Enterococcus dongliensis]MDT